MKKISVIIPCYNAEKYLQPCLESLEKQTIGLDCLELIFVNDALTDATLQILDEFQKKHPASVVIIDNKENLHQGGARNLGLARATADYIAFMDDDDIMENSVLEKLYNKAEEKHCDLVVSYAKKGSLEERTATEMGRTGREDRFLEITNEKERGIFLQMDINRAIWNKLYRRALIMEHKIDFLEHMIYDDLYFSGLIKRYVRSIYILEEYLYYHVVHEKAASVSTENWEHKIGYFDSNLALIKLLKERNLYKNHEVYYENDFIVEYITVVSNFIKIYGRIPYAILKRMIQETVHLFPLYYKNEIINAYLKKGPSPERSACKLLFVDFDTIVLSEGDRIEDILIGDPSKEYSFSENLKNLIGLLRLLTVHLLNNEMARFNGAMQELSELLGVIFPLIISSYTKPQLQDVAADALYWSEQLGKIVGVLEEEDRFKIIDVLYYETRENLMNYQRMITERGIVI